MTPKGMYGSSFEAPTPEAAADLAEIAGYHVVDITDVNGETVLVVPDDEPDKFTWQPGDVGWGDYPAPHYDEDDDCQCPDHSAQRHAREGRHNWPIRNIIENNS
jgi:hypothetical protein